MTQRCARPRFRGRAAAWVGDGFRISIRGVDLVGICVSNSGLDLIKYGNVLPASRRASRLVCPATQKAFRPLFPFGGSSLACRCATRVDPALRSLS